MIYDNDVISKHNKLEFVFLQFMFYILFRYIDFLNSPPKTCLRLKFTSRVQIIQNWSVKFEGAS